MANQPSIFKTKVSLQLDNEVIVALDKKAKDDCTSRNAVANYLLSSALDKLIKRFSKSERELLREMEIKNMEARRANA